MNLVDILTNLGHLELAIITITLINIITYIYGSRQNRQIAHDLYQRLSVLLNKNFSRLDSLTCDSADTFSFYATGTTFASGVTFTLALPARQDALSLLTSAVVTSSKPETLTVEIHDVLTKEDHLFAVCARKGVWKSLIERFPLINKCTKHERDVAKMPMYRVTGDSAEISDLFLKSMDAGILAELDELVLRDGVLIAKLRVGENAEKLIEGILAILEKMTVMGISEKSRMAAKEMREVKETEVQKRDRLEQKKADKYKAMSTEERDKYDKKMEKKELMKMIRR
jgi:hypothetical protein